MVEVTSGAERLVVKADAASELTEFLAEEVNRLEHSGRSRELVVRGGKELLVAAINEARYFSADQRAGALIVCGRGARGRSVLNWTSLN